jgi:hypothetical protein
VLGAAPSTIAPGMTNGDAAALRVNGDLDLLSTTTYEVDLFTSADRDVLVMTNGTAHLDGATLAVNVQATPTNGQQFTILTRTGPGTIQGRFAQDTSLSVSGALFGITYTTNSVMLTRVGNTPVVTAFSMTSGPARLILSGTNGHPFVPYDLVTSTNLDVPPATWQVVASNQFDAAGHFAVTNLVNPSLPQRFFHIRTP